MRDCEPIQVDLCRNLGYDYTGMPSLVGHDNQQEAEQQLKTFTPLIQYGCSAQLTVFLCAAYLPMCTEKVVDPIGPCATLCESVRGKCQPVLNEFGFPWPPALNCSKFPPRNEDDRMCIDPPNPDPEEPERIWTMSPKSVNVLDPKLTVSATQTSAASRTCDGFRRPDKYVFVNRTQRCALRCPEDDVFTSGQKDFVDDWMSVWSGLCFAATLLTILTFLIDSSRFAYPERAMIFMAFCYNVCSVAYLVRLIAGREAISCRPANDDTAAAVTAWSTKVLVQEGLENTDCTVVFLLLYYFSMAGNIWWVVLTVLWSLNVGLDWPRETLSRHGTLLHVVAWSVPAVMTVVALVLRSVDADELTGMCYVGYQNAAALLWFVIVPLCVLLLLGFAFQILGFTFVFRRDRDRDLQRRGGDAAAAAAAGHVAEEGRNNNNGWSGGSQARSSSSSRTFAFRIGAFSLVYAALCACAVACHCYEYVNRQSWPVAATSTGSGKEDAAPPPREPNVPLLVFGAAVGPITGIVSAVWLWRCESLGSWRAFCARLCRFRCCLPAFPEKDCGGNHVYHQGKVPVSVAGLQDYSKHHIRCSPASAVKGPSLLKPTQDYRTGVGGAGGGSGAGGVPVHTPHKCHHHHPRKQLIGQRYNVDSCELNVVSQSTNVRRLPFNNDITVL